MKHYFILLFAILVSFNLSAQEDDRGYIVETGQMAPDPGAGVFALFALKEAGVTRNVIIDRDGKIVYLTRLYDEKEFNGMKEAINKLMVQ
jgi:hypothetical protein